MRIAIVEDELLAVTYLKNLLEDQTIVDVSSIIILRSRKQAITFFKEHSVDLIFMDIHLGDGKSFEIFQEVELLTPIIFITAYDEYAMKVFKHFTIDYILKPFEVEELHIALQKFNSIRTSFDIAPTLKSITVLENSPSEIMHRFLVTNGNKLRSVEEHEIAYFFASGKHLFMKTKDEQTYIYDDTIKDIINKLDETMFFKINRKFIVHIDAITEIIKHSSQKIEIYLQPKPETEQAVFISKTQINSWMDWMNR
ncbi:LytTR family DNA-binding domain-containing protein [Empedobacter stercoris]|uniref:LytR/AlgR family response regulator transcription factor n=1 Tax=Empedobacter TaxID=59734 RepID=UPI001D34FFFE|nr:MULTISPECIES: LytTR family DNA-binding domain-containing protein [Empedobacter]MDM1523249.1 response regulator transcription factor [Empedobacter sp. 225-1]MDM1542496.1 response regulator transcription factor [Empedobacter sp. 189-2]UWX67464.1 LytTR family DNA-binding domain-containing protein [Empedobacter stercoris]HJD87522.1 LytTR family DNA-binding domain-containing protein [Empedobacter falsenii]